MKKYIEITKVKQLGDFSLLLTFNEEIEKVINFTNIFRESNGLYKVLKNKKEFKKYRIDMAGGLVWDCGLDLAPDMLFKYKSEG